MADKSYEEWKNLLAKQIADVNLDITYLVGQLEEARELVNSVDVISRKTNKQALLANERIETYLALLKDLHGKVKESSRMIADFDEASCQVNLIFK